jgi:AraC-like DNA-binding protein
MPRIIEQLARLIAETTSREGSQATAIPGLYLTRSSTTNLPRQTLDRAVFCVVAQGSKCIMIENKRLLYDPSTYLLVSLDLPAVSQIMKASRKEPFLGLSMVLDFPEITSLIAEAKLPPLRDKGDRSGIAVHKLDEDLLDAVMRLACLLKKPTQIPILAPLIRHEIFYKLLLSEGGGLLQRMTAENGKVQRIAKGLEWLRLNATRTIRMEELAREVGMSPSTMHQWFRSVTSMSPLQFQKQLRLQRARTIMLSECMDATMASRRVGYESPSQFSREYRRLFGAPPLKDVERFRMLQTQEELPRK